MTFSHPGNYVLRLSAANAFGETSSTLAVSAQDLTPPVITVPPDITAEATNAAGAVVNFSTSALDAVSGALSTTNTPASGSTFPLGTTTVTVTASDVAGNVSSGTFTITVTPAVMSFDSWAAGIFNEDELADESISGPNATPANDGLTNLLKYALGLPPKIPSTAGVQFAKSGESLTFVYQRPADRPDLDYRVEVSPALGVDWTTSGVVHARIAEGDPESWQGTYTPGAGNDRIFFRLHVSKP